MGYRSYGYQANQHLLAGRLNHPKLPVEASVSNAAACESQLMFTAVCSRLFEC
jgi:hypothetical protein